MSTIETQPTDTVKDMAMTQHFVVFQSPGTFVHEETKRQIPSWSVAEAMRMADEITERYGATPFGFYFETRHRGAGELDSHVAKLSCRYYLGGTVRSRAEIEAKADPEEAILLGNMKSMGWDRVVENRNSFRITLPLLEGDEILEYTPPSKRG